MSSTSVAQHIGVLDFKTVHIKADEVATAFQEFVGQGSKLTGVSIEDISTNVLQLPENTATVTIAELLAVGMKLFDAVIWLSAGKPDDAPLTVDPSMERTKIPSLQQVAKAVFYTFFFILTQARYPASSQEDNPPAVPNFLRVVMGLDRPQNEYIEMLCSFNAKSFDAKWARYVSFEGLGQEALSRFGLGVAGYRMFAPFKVFNPKPNLAPALMTSFNFARRVARAPPTWDIHPSTRNPTVLSRRGNLNKNLGNLILEVFTEEDITKMVNSKMLYRRPVNEPNYGNYMAWEEDDDISGSTTIFLGTS